MSVKKLTGFALMKLEDPVRFKILQSERGKKAHIKYPYLNKKIIEIQRINNTGFFKDGVQSKAGKIGGKKAQITLKRERKGFYNPEISKQANVIQKEKKTGFFNSELQRELSKRSKELQIKRKVGFFNSISMKKLVEKSIKTRRENKIGFFSKEFHHLPHIILSRIGNKNMKAKAGLISVQKHRLKKPYFYNNIPFDSNQEREMAILISNKFKVILKENINCHIRVGNNEYHPWDRKYTPLEYYNKRREILNKNGFQNSGLLLLKNLNELKLVQIK